MSPVLRLFFLYRKISQTSLEGLIEMFCFQINTIKMSGDAGVLKRSLEGWREMVVLTDSVLSWEKVDV